MLYSYFILIYKMKELICPLTRDNFKTLMMKSTQFYTEEDIDLLYQANEALKKEKIGGRSKGQDGGLQCLTLHNINRYSLSILLFIGGIYCGIFKRSEVANTILTFVEMSRTAFAEEHFKHIWDVVGKTQLGFGFMERVTKYILEAFKNPKQGVTMTWMKNLFELLCKVEEGPVENVDQKLKDIVVQASNEMFEQEQPLQQQQPLQPTQNIVYDGKIITIEMGDAMITISPNIFKSHDSSVFMTPRSSPKNVGFGRMTYRKTKKMKTKKNKTNKKK